MKQYIYLFAFIIFYFLGINQAYADNDHVEQELAKRVQQAQIGGNDSDFYDAHSSFLNHLEKNQAWDKYYRAWMNRVIYDVNHKHFNRAYTEIHRLTEDIRDRHQEQYLYISHMCLGFFYSGRNQPEMGETYFRKALQGIDADKEPV